MGLRVSRGSARVGRNQQCPCNSGKKFKKCCITKRRSVWDNMPNTQQRAIDYGEDAIKWVICDQTGTKFFVDKQGRILVFSDKAVAREAATLEVFKDQEPNEINVAGVGPTKWKKIQDELPHVEVENSEMAAALINERIDYQQSQLEESRVTVQEFKDEKETPSES
jgi:uncharacterized protein YecA (UPF0149 family)